MKVTFKYAVGSYSGTIDLAVFRPTHTKLASYMRKWVMPTLTENNELLGVISKNVALEIWNKCLAGYKADMQTYADRWFQENSGEGVWDPYKSRYAAFTKLMWHWMQDDPEHIDLATVTMEDVQALGTKIMTVKDAIDYGLLPSISVYDDLTNVIYEWD